MSIMKNAIIFSVAIILFSLSLSAQYSTDYLVGTWYTGSDYIQLNDDNRKSAKMKTKSGVKSGTWAYTSIGFGEGIKIELDNTIGSYNFEIISVSESKLELLESDLGYFSFEKRNSSNNDAAIAASALIIGAGLLWLMSGDSGSSTDSYQTETQRSTEWVNRQNRIREGEQERAAAAVRRQYGY